jgi:hypothetical protein
MAVAVMLPAAVRPVEVTARSVSGGRTVRLVSWEERLGRDRLFAPRKY